MRQARLTAITGGIGAGKSVVSRILTTMGYDVYDCDCEAKRLMDSSEDIKQRIAKEIADEAISDDGVIDRKRLSAIVFADVEKLSILNDIVHKAVIKHLKQWCDMHGRDRRLFVETAILYQSGLDRHVDEVWEVIAPKELRILRVMQRNGLSRSAVENRISSQSIDIASPHPNIHTIVNDDFTPVLPQITELIKID